MDEHIKDEYEKGHRGYDKQNRRTIKDSQREQKRRILRLNRYVDGVRYSRLSQRTWNIQPKAPSGVLPGRDGFSQLLYDPYGNVFEFYPGTQDIPECHRGSGVGCGCQDL